MADKKDIVQDYVGMLEYTIAEIRQLSGAIETTILAVNLMLHGSDERNRINGSLEVISVVCDDVQEQLVRLIDDFYDVVKRLEENDAT